MKQFRNRRYRDLVAAIVEARLAAGLSQRQLATKLQRSAAFIWKIEAGERGIDVMQFVEIAEALDVEASVLLGKI